ncbi:MAG: DeoR family transcriptional regulator [Ginsengibacter sp.]
MLRREQQSFILHEANLHNKVLSVDLIRQINESDYTIKRDFHQLSVEGKIIKVNGGALSPSFHNSHTSSKNVYVYKGITRR